LEKRLFSAGIGLPNAEEGSRPDGCPYVI